MNIVHSVNKFCKLSESEGTRFMFSPTDPTLGAPYTKDLFDMLRTTLDDTCAFNTVVGIMDDFKTIPFPLLKPLCECAICTGRLDSAYLMIGMSVLLSRRAAVHTPTITNCVDYSAFISLHNELTQLSSKLSQYTNRLLLPPSLRSTIRNEIIAFASRFSKNKNITLSYIDDNELITMLKTLELNINEIKDLMKRIDNNS